MDTRSLDLFAVTAPGLAGLAAEELRLLGIRPLVVEPAGVAFRGSAETLFRANLWLRTASRVLARVDEFPARAFYELDKVARRLPWERFLSGSRPVRLRVTCRKSRLYHSDAVAERISRAIETRLGGAAGFHAAASDDSDGAEAEAGSLVVARLFHDRCTLSVDSSGALLHLRGYRQATAKAPLRETLGAAMVIATGWGRVAGNARPEAGATEPARPASEPSRPLVDPFCGAGTIAIEAALIARHIAPGLQRDFAFMDWPGFDAGLWERVRGEAHAAIRPSAVRIQASDRDPGAIQAAQANAARAGVERDIEFSLRPLSAVEPPPGPGWLVTNPPYGVRVGERDRLRNLYAQLGNVARRVMPGWTLAFLSADVALERSVGLGLATLLETSNGGIPVRLVEGKIPPAPAPPERP